MQPLHGLPSDLERHGEGLKGGRTAPHSSFVHSGVVDAEEETVMALAPEHRADLHASNLKDRAIELMQCVSLRPK